MFRTEENEAGASLNGNVKTISQGRPGFLGIRYPGLFNNEYTVSFIRIFEYRYTGF